MRDSERGVYQKFTVTRTDGKSAPGEKHDGCEYFVLDCAHDPHAKPALMAYADSCEAKYPKLAADARRMAEGVRLLSEQQPPAQSAECPKNAALRALLWPNVPSADDLSLLVAMCAGTGKRAQEIRPIIERLRKAQSAGSAALALPCTASPLATTRCECCGGSGEQDEVDWTGSVHERPCTDCAGTGKVSPCTASPCGEPLSAVHPEAYCHKCGGRNVVWFAPNELWNAVDPEVGIICPVCFVTMAESRGITPTGWMLVSEGHVAPHCGERAVLRFAIRWRDGKYSVSIPSYDGGEVVEASAFDRLTAENAELRDEVERLKAVGVEAVKQITETDVERITRQLTEAEAECDRLRADGERMTTEALAFREETRAKLFRLELWGSKANGKLRAELAAKDAQIAEMQAALDHEREQFVTAAGEFAADMERLKEERDTIANALAILAMKDASDAEYGRLDVQIAEMRAGLVSAEGHLAEDLENPQTHPIHDCPVLNAVRAILEKYPEGK